MNGEELALLTVIRANPEDDTARLVYADWLDEHDRGDEAQYLRDSVDLVRECAPRDPVLQPFILTSRLPPLRELRGRLRPEWLAVVHSPRFDLLDEDEAQRTVRHQIETEHARIEAERRRREAEVEERRQREWEQQRQWQDHLDYEEKRKRQLAEAEQARARDEERRARDEERRNRQLAKTLNDEEEDRKRETREAAELGSKVIFFVCAVPLVIGAAVLYWLVMSTLGIDSQTSVFNLPAGEAIAVVLGAVILLAVGLGCVELIASFTVDNKIR